MYAIYNKKGDRLRLHGVFKYEDQAKGVAQYLNGQWKGIGATAKKETTREQDRLQEISRRFEMLAESGWNILSSPGLNHEERELKKSVIQAKELVENAIRLMEKINNNKF